MAGDSWCCPWASFGLVTAIRARRVDVVGVGDNWGKGCSTGELESIRQMHGLSFWFASTFRTRVCGNELERMYGEVSRLVMAIHAVLSSKSIGRVQPQAPGGYRTVFAAKHQDLPILPGE